MGQQWKLPSFTDRMQLVRPNLLRLMNLQTENASQHFRPKGWEMSPLQQNLREHASETPGINHTIANLIITDLSLTGPRWTNVRNGKKIHQAWWREKDFDALSTTARYLLDTLEQAGWKYTATSLVFQTTLPCHPSAVLQGAKLQSFTSASPQRRLCRRSQSLLSAISVVKNAIHLAYTWTRFFL